MKRISLLVCLVLIFLKVDSQSLSTTQMQNARATGYAVIASRNPGTSFSVLMIPWDGINTLEYNAQKQINPGWHAQAAIKGNYFYQAFDGSDFTSYSSVLLSQEEFDAYKNVGTQWWIACSTLPPFSNSGFKINSNGNVGIGTLSPQSILDVITPTNGYASFATQMGVGNWSGIHFGYRENNTLYRKSAIVFERTDNSGGGGNAAGKVHILNGPSSGAGSATLSDAKLTIGELGNVGIGTTSPQSILDVVTPSYGYASFASQMGVGGWSGIHFGYRENNTLYRKSAIVFERTDNSGGGGNAAGKVHILNGPSSGAGSATLSDAKLTIGELGNVGIGSLNPYSKLDVKFQAPFNPTTPGATPYGLFLSGQSTPDYATGITFSAADASPGSAQSGIYSQGSGSYGTKLYFATTDSYASGAKTRMMIDAAGNIGIGSLNPYSKLDVKFQAPFNPTTPGATPYGLFLSGQSTPDYATGITFSAGDASPGTAQSGIYSQGAGAYGTKLYFATTDSYVSGAKTRMMIDAAGNLGIGTLNPSFKLDVAGSGRFSSTIKSSAHIDNDARRILSPEGGSYVGWTPNISGAIKIKLPAAQNNSSTMMMFRVKVYQYSTGMSHEFQIGGYNYNMGNWYNVFATNLTDNGSNFNIRFGHDGTSDCVWIGETNNNWTYPQVFVTDFQSGFLGNSDEWAKGWNVSFVPSFDNVEQVRLAAQVITSNNISSYVGNANGTANYIPKFTSNTALGNSAIYEAAGNVGIGTTTPGSYKLAVEGTIGARKMKITQQGIPWADYVFQDDYQLRSLEALDKYIQQYKHLPEVPTTKEVNENGLDVADTQALLLKKIEELTLYMIELKKQNEQLTNRVKKLEKK
jgi:hypothetical protein